MEKINFYSTNHESPDVTLREALLTGQAPDKGLYMPSTIPQFEEGELATYKDLSYSQIAYRVLRKFTQGIFEDDKLLEMCERVYNYDVPLEHVYDDVHVMRLDQGPTASFKDFAAAMMGQWMSALMQEEGGELLILTATSGDTGSAIANAFHNVDGISVLILFPPAEVSDRQRKQMTTLGNNVATIGLDGKFDDCQALVKQAFADPNLNHIRLTSANSINIGRLLPQIVYYVYAYSRIAKDGEEVVFSVPSGNFGDMMGALLGKKMGLPIKTLVIATNANHEVPTFLKTGEYNKIVPSIACISNAMNVGHPSNFARVIDLYEGQMDEKGTLNKEAQLETMRKEMWSISIDDEATRATIREAWDSHKLVLEPHGAVGWAGLQAFVKDTGYSGPMVSVETAHPAKFPQEIQSLLSFDPEVPPSLAGIEEKDEAFDEMKNSYEDFCSYLKEKY